MNWVKTDRPGQVVRIAEAQITDDPGEAASKFVVKADTDDLNGTSFTCIVSSPSVAEESQLRCTTPVINVLSEYDPQVISLFMYVILCMYQGS